MRYALVLALAAVALTAPESLRGATVVAGLVGEGPDPETWDLAGSPYRVTGDIAVGTLVIDRGVRVEFEGEYLFRVDGTLTAHGTAEAPIVFTSASRMDPENHRWKGILFDGTQPGSELVHCIIEYASLSGLRFFQSTQTVEHCTVRRNTKTTADGQSGQGGGIEIILDEGDFVLRDCAILENDAALHGGGIRARMGTGTLRVERCALAGNRANPAFSREGYYGGGLYAAGRVELKNCVIEGNLVRACRYGGGLDPAHGGGAAFTAPATVRMENCLVRRNLAEAHNCNDKPVSFGGGVYYAGGEALEVVNCILAENDASAFAGWTYGNGVFVDGGTARVVNSTLYGNKPAGLHVRAGSATLLNSIAYCNSNACENPAGGAQLSGAVACYYSSIQGGWDGEGAENIPWNPLFNNTTELRILPGSPCIDAGHPGGDTCDPPGFPNECDASGLPLNPGAPADRWDDVCFPPSLGTTRNDIGAHGGPLGCDWDLPFDCNRNWILDWNDIASGTSLDCNRNGLPDECDIASGTAPDTDPRDGIIDTCTNLAELAVTATEPLVTLTVRLTTAVPTRGGEVAVGVDPEILRVAAVRPGPDFPDPDTGFSEPAEMVLDPEDPAAGNLACPGGSPAGVAIGWVNPQDGTELLGAGTHDLFEIDLEFQPGAPAGQGSLAQFVHCLGRAARAPITNTVTAADGSSIPLVPLGTRVVQEAFARGDANDDGRFDISDPVNVLVCMFTRVELCPTCPDAADADDNGTLEMADAIYLLTWRFRGGPEPPVPFPGCGRDTTDDDLASCLSSHCPRS